MTVNKYALSVVFCNTKRMTDEVTETLGSKGILAEALHGDLSQSSTRQSNGANSEKGHCTVLVCN